MTRCTMADTEIVPSSNSWFGGWLQWCPYSSTMLRTAEKKILSCLKTAYRGWYVDIGSVVGTSDKIWTISLNEESKKLPILLLHGLGAGVALWCLNLDALANRRPVYAIDILGFGRSSRPAFSSDATEAEQQLVRSVEEWRREMNIDKFILLGHSMGGFVAASYALSHPGRVGHLILADPWGFPEKPEDISTRFSVPFWVKAVVYVTKPFNPLWAVRAAGPFGQWLIQKMRPDIMRKFSTVVGEDHSVIAQYIHQCNAQTPSGEGAFHAMMSSFGWAKNPMINRLNHLTPEIPITLLYGSRSWVENAPGETIKERRPDSYVNVQIISGAGHHVYADKYDAFNKHVIEACEVTDELQNKGLLAILPKETSLDNDGEAIEAGTSVSR